MPAIIFSTRLNNFKPIHRGGIELYRYADRLRTLLNDKLGPSYSELLAVPSISEDAKHFHDNAHWRSDYVTNSQSLTLLSQEDQQNAAQRLQLYLDTINNLVSQLLADADAKNRELGDFLSQAVQIPSLDCVRVDNDRIVLVLWGFSSDESQKKNFRISKALDSYRIAAAAKAPVVSGLPQLKAETPATTQPQVTQKADSFETSDKRKVWWWMLGALLLLGLSLLIGWLLLHYGKGDGAAFIPDNPASVQPVDPGQTRPDPTDSLRRVRVMNRLLILLDKQQTMEMFAAELAKRYTPDQLRISHFNANVNLVQVTFEDANYSRWTRELTSIPGVVTIIPEYLASPVGATIPHDPNFSVTADCYHFKAIRAFEAWNLTMGNPGLIVAVVDGGLDVHHIELKGKIVHPFDIVPDKETIQLVPGQVHGTHVAGLAVGAANNGQGASGVAPNCQLMPIQISDANLKGSGLSTVNIIAGLSYAIKNGAKVVNMSLGLSLDTVAIQKLKKMTRNQQELLAQQTALEETILWQEVFAYARRSNVIVVKAAGNEGIIAELDPMNRSNDVIVVGATDQQNQLTSFSNYGSRVHVCAPGNLIFSTIPTNKYALLSGTSMSAPIVAGGIALMLSRNPTLTLEQIKLILRNTGLSLHDRDGKTIGPLIQLAQAVAQAGAPPITDCQVSVDSLVREIDRLKRGAKKL